MLAKAVDALSLERSQKNKIESFSKSYMEEKEFLCKIIENNPEGSYFCEELAGDCSYYWFVNNFINIGAIHPYEPLNSLEDSTE